jgi:hypothetical protein
MEQAPTPRFSFHARMVGMMTILSLTDIGMLAYSVHYTLRKGPSMMIIFGFEVSKFGCSFVWSLLKEYLQYTILITSNLSTLMKYIIHTIDLRSPNPWEEKSMYIFYVDLVVGKSWLNPCHSNSGNKRLTHFPLPSRLLQIVDILAVLRYCHSLLWIAFAYHPRLVYDAEKLHSKVS